MCKGFGTKTFFYNEKTSFFLKLTPMVRLQTAPTNFMGYRSNMGTGNELPYYELPEFGTSWKRRDSQIPSTRKTRAVGKPLLPRGDAIRRFPYREGNPATISTVFRLTWMTRAIRSTIYRGSASRFGSFTIPLRLSILTRY